MNLEEIKELIKLVSKTGIGKVRIENEEFKLVIEGGSNNDEPLIVQAPTQPFVAAAPVITPTPVVADKITKTEAVENDNSNQDLRIKFLQNKINEDEFSSLLYKRYKHNKGYSSGWF